MSTASLNQVTILGTLGRDADSKFTTSGVNVCNLAVATNDRWKDKDSGEWKEKVEWHRVTLWRGENLAPYLVKGQQVMITGKLETREWEKEGQKHYTTEIIADRIQLVGGKKPEAGQASAAAAPAAAKPAAARPARTSAPKPQAPATQPEISDDDVPF